MSPVNQITKKQFCIDDQSVDFKTSVRVVTSTYLCVMQPGARSSIMTRKYIGPRSPGHWSIQGQPLRNCSLCTHPLVSVGQVAFTSLFIMATLWNRAGHYIFALWFLSSTFLFSSPNFSGRRLDVYHTSTHDVALVRT